MEITRIIGIGIIGTILAVTVRNYRPEIGIGIAAATGIAIFAIIVPELKNVFDELSVLCKDTGVNPEFFEVTAKIIGIAYITQYSSELAKDSGEGAISKKIEFAGKISVVFLMMPAIKNLISTIVNALMTF